MLHMIIIDDEAIIRESLNRFMDWDSIGVSVANVFANGSLALDSILQNTPDIILTDINMPSLNGIELLEFLRYHHIDSQVIFISAYSKFEYAQAALRLGAFDYVLKPIDEGNLLNIVSSCAKKILSVRQQSEQLDTFKKENITLLHSLLKRFFCDYNYQLSTADSMLLEDFHITSENYKQTICAGIQFSKDTDISKISYTELFKDCPFEHRIDILELSDTLHILLFWSSQTDSNLVSQYFKSSLTKLLESDLHIPVEQIAVSNCYDSLSQFKHFYTEIQLTLLLTFTDKPAPIVSFSSIHRKSSHLNFILEPDVLLAFVNDGNVQQIDNLLLNTLHSYTKDGLIYDLPMLKLNYIQLIDYILNNLRTYHLHDCLEVDTLSSQKTIHAQSCLTDLYTAVHNIFINIANFMKGLQDKNAPQLVRLCIEYIHENYTSNISLTEIASKIYVSPAYLSKIFSSQIKVSFSKYVLEYRIQRSLELLADPQNKIYDIASMCGFSDIAHFSKSFKQHMGISPHKYRNKL